LTHSFSCWIFEFLPKGVNSHEALYTSKTAGSIFYWSTGSVLSPPLGSLTHSSDAFNLCNKLNDASQACRARNPPKSSDLYNKKSFLQGEVNRKKAVKLSVEGGGAALILTTFLEISYCQSKLYHFDLQEVVENSKVIFFLYLIIDQTFHSLLRLAQRWNSWCVLRNLNRYLLFEKVFYISFVSFKRQTCLVTK